MAVGDEGGAVDSSSKFYFIFKGAVSGTIVGEPDSQKVAYGSGPSFGTLRDVAPGRLGGEARGRHSGWLHRAIDLQWSLDRSATVHYRSSRLGVHMAYHVMPGSSHRSDHRCLASVLGLAAFRSVVLGALQPSLRPCTARLASSSGSPEPLLSERYGSGSPEPSPALWVEDKRPSAATLLVAISPGS